MEKIQKEPAQIRKERLRLAKAMMTKAVQNPKAYNRKKEKKFFDIRGINVR